MRAARLCKAMLVTVVTAFATSYTVTAAAACNGGQPVKFAELGWDSGRFTTEIFRVVLERGYDCKTESVPGSNAIVLNAVISGDLDAFAEYPTGRTPIVEAAAKDGKVQLVGNILQGGVQEGFYVPAYVIKGDPKRNIKALAPNLTSVAQLGAYSSVFADDEEPGKGRIMNCPIGWQCESDNTEKIKAYKLSAEYTNFHPGTGAALDAAIVSAFKRGRPIVFYYWQPSTILGKYDAIRLTETPYNQACWEGITNKIAEPCPSASPPNTVKVILSRKAMQSDPALVDLATKVNLTLKDVETQLAKIDDQKISPRQAASDFIAQNPALVRSWVPANVAAKVLASK